MNPNEQFANYAWSGQYRETGSAFWWLYEYAFKPLTATMFAMLAFYVASAAFRAFRAKNVEAILLLGTAFIILLVLLVLTGLDFTTAFSAVAATLNNLGIGFAGVSGGFGALGEPTKAILCFAMLLGRLEIFTLLVLFTPVFWRI